MSKPNQQGTEVQAKKRRQRQRVQREPEVQVTAHKQTVGPGAVSLGASRVGTLRRTEDAGRGGNGGQPNLAFDAGMLFEGGTVEAQAEVLQRLDGTQRRRAVQRIGDVQGNRHVQRVVTAYDGLKGGNGGNTKKRVSSAGTLQTKLEVSEVGDEYEQEADAVAEQVMLMSAAPPADEAPMGGDNGGNGVSGGAGAPFGGELSLWDLLGRDMGLAMLFEGETASGSVGRKANRCTGGDCLAEAALLKSNVQRQEGKAAGPLHRQRKPNRCTTPDCQGEATLFKQETRRWASQEETSEVAPDLEERVRALQGRGAPLPEGERAFFEPRLGRDLSQVRIHADGEAAGLSQGLGARAFALGGDIAFGEGEFRPGTEEGRWLMAHELAHVVQQGAAEPLEDTSSSDDQAGQEQQPAESDGQAATGTDAKEAAGGEAAEAQEGKASQTGREEGQQPALRDSIFNPVVEDDSFVPMEGASAVEAYTEGQKEALERTLSERAEPLAVAHEALEGTSLGEAAAILKGQASQVAQAEVRLPLGLPTMEQTGGESVPEQANEVVDRVRQETEHPQTVKEAEADGFQALSSQTAENQVVPSGGMVEQAGVAVPEGAAGEANLAQNPAFESRTYKRQSKGQRRGLTDAGGRPNLNVSRGYRSVELGQQRAAAGMQVGAQAAETEAIARADYGQHEIYPTEEGRGVTVEGETGDAGVTGSLEAAAEFVEEIVEEVAPGSESDPDALCREDWDKRQLELEEEEAALETEKEALEKEEADQEAGEKRIVSEQKDTQAQALALRQQGAEQERERQELRDKQLALNAQRRELARQEKESEGGNPALAAQKAQLEAQGAQLRGQKVRLKQAGRQRTYRQKQTRAQEVGLREKEDRHETYGEGLEERFASQEEREAWLEEAWRALEEEMATGCQRGKGGGGGGGGGAAAAAMAADEEALAAQAAALEKERQELEARRALLAEQVEYDAAAVMATAVAENDALLASFANLSTLIDAEAQADIAKILADAETESKEILAQAESDAEARQKQGEKDAEQAIRYAQAAAADVAEGEDPGPIIAWGQRQARQILATMQSDVNQIIEKGQQEVEKRLQEAEVAAGVRTEVAATDQDVLAQDTADESAVIADQASTDVGVVVDGGVEELDAEIAASDARVVDIVEEDLPGTAMLAEGGSDYYTPVTSGYWPDGYGVEEPVAEPPVYTPAYPYFDTSVSATGVYGGTVIADTGWPPVDGYPDSVAPGPDTQPPQQGGGGPGEEDEPPVGTGTPTPTPTATPTATPEPWGPATPPATSTPSVTPTPTATTTPSYESTSVDGDDSTLVVPAGDQAAATQARLQIQDAWAGLTDEQRENMPAEEQAALLLASVQGVEALQVPEPYRPTTSMEAQWYYSQPHEPPAMNQDQVRIMVDALQNIEGLPEEVRTQVIWQAAGFDSQETLQALNGVAQTTTMSPVQQADALLTTLQNQPGFENLPPAERAAAMYQIVVLQMPSVPERVKGAAALTFMSDLEEEVVSGLIQAFEGGDTERFEDYQGDVGFLAYMHECLGKDFINRTVGLDHEDINTYLLSLEGQVGEFSQLGEMEDPTEFRQENLDDLDAISRKTGFLIEDLPATPTEALQGLRGVSEEDWAKDIMISGKIPEEAFQFDLDQIQAEIGVFSQGHEFAAQLSTDQAQVTVAALQSSDTFNSLSPTQQALAATMWIEQLPGLSWEARGIATTAILDGINADIMSQVVDIVVETGVQSDEGLDDFKNLVLELAQVNSVYAVAAPAYVSHFAGYSPEMAEKYASDLSVQITEGREAVELLYFTGLDHRDALGGFDDYLEFKGMEDHGNQNVRPLLEAMAIFGASYEQMSALIPEFRTESSYRQTIASADTGLDSIDVLSQTLWLEVPEDRLLTDPTFDAGMMARQAYQSLDSGNEAQFFELIDELEPEELQATFDAFTRYSPKRIDEWNLSEEEKARLQAIMQGNVALSDAIAVEIAIDQSNPEALANLLRNRTPKDIADIERLYQDRCDGSLESHLEDAFGEYDADLIEALLAGDTATADAIAIYQADDLEAVAEIYERSRQEVIAETRDEFLTTAELEVRIRERNQEIEAAYLNYTGESLEQRFSTEVYFDQVGVAGAMPSITDLAYLDLVRALADHDQAGIDAARLTLAAETGDDEAKLEILRSQYDRAREEVSRDQLAAFYQQIQSSGGSGTPTEVLQAWQTVLGAASPDYMAYLDQLTQDVADENMQGFLGAYEGRLGEYNALGVYTNQMAMSAGLGNMMLPDGEGGLFPAFLSWHDPVLEELAGRLIGTSGNLPREEELYYAVLRKDEDVINAILYSGANPGDLAQEYAQCLIDKGVTDELDIGALRDDLEDALKGDDEADALATLQEGELTPEAQLRILQRRVEHEQDDGWATYFLDWSGLQERSIMSNSLFESEAAYYRWQMAEQNFPDTEMARQAYTQFEQAMGRTEFDIEQHRDAEDVLSNTVGNVTATVVGIGATIAIVLIFPGAAPIIVAAGSSVAGSAASMGVQALMEGDAYEDEWREDAGNALVDLGISVLTAGMGERLPVHPFVGEIVEEGTASVLDTIITLPPEQWGDALKSLPMDVLVELVVGQMLEIGLEEIQMRRQMGRGANFADFHRNVVELDNGMGTVTTATTLDGNVRSVLQLDDGTTLRIAPELARVLPDQPELFAFLQTHAELLAPGHPNFDSNLSQRLLQPEIAQVLSQNPNLVNLSNDPVAVADIAALSADVPVLQGTPEEIAALFHFGSGTDVGDLQIAGERQQWYIRNGFPYIEGYEWYARRDADGDLVYRPRRRANLDSESITDPALRQIFENQDSKWDVQQGAFTYNDENGRPASYRPPDPATGAPGVRTEQVMMDGTLVTQVTMIAPDGTPVLCQVNDASGRRLRTETFDSAGEVINRTGVSVEEYNSFPESVQQRIREGTIPPEELESNLNIVRAFQGEMGDYGDLFNAVFEAETPEARLEASNALLAQIAPPVALLGGREGGLQSVQSWLNCTLEAQVGDTGIDTSRYTDAINATDNPLDALALYRNASDVFVRELKGFTPTFDDPVGQAMIRDLMETTGISESEAMANIAFVNQATANFDSAVTSADFNTAMGTLAAALENPALSPDFAEQVRTQFLEPYQGATPEMRAYMREMYLEGGILPSHAIGLKAFSENVNMTLAFRQTGTAAGLWGLMGVPGKPMGWGLSAELLEVGARNAGVFDDIVELAQTNPQIAERVEAYKATYPQKSEEDWIFMAMGEWTGGARLTSFKGGPFAGMVYSPAVGSLGLSAEVRGDYDLGAVFWNGQALTDAQIVPLVPIVDAAATGRLREPLDPDDLVRLMDAVASGNETIIQEIQMTHLGEGYVPQEILHSSWLTYYKPGTDQRLLDSNPGPLSVIAPDYFATVPDSANANWFWDATTPGGTGPVGWPAHWGGDTVPWESTDFRNTPTVQPTVEPDGSTTVDVVTPDGDAIRFNTTRDEFVFETDRVTTSQHFTDGSEVIVDVYGRALVLRGPDGSVTVCNNDGSLTRVGPSGERESVTLDDDGRVTVYTPTGLLRVLEPIDEEYEEELAESHVLRDRFAAIQEETDPLKRLGMIEELWNELEP